MCMPAGLYLQEGACHVLLLGGGPLPQGTGRGGGHPHGEVQAVGAPGHLLPRYKTATALPDLAKRTTWYACRATLGDVDTAAHAAMCSLFAYTQCRTEHAALAC